MDKKAFDFWLYSTQGIGKKTFLQLKEAGYDGQNLYATDKDKLPDFLKEKQKASIINAKALTEMQIEEKYEKLRSQGIFMTVFGDIDYPERFYKIPDTPAVLFYKGALPKKMEKSIAIIGARNCSEYGKSVAREFADFFAQNHMTVISGMARGIDSFAQQKALESGGNSVAVLGCGVGVCYPYENLFLYRELIKKGCVLSEYFPYENARANYFPQRNRLISGLADAILVVEAKEKSGTFITVEMALEQGKDVYVVPGRVTDLLSRGCNKLLYEGANMAISPEKMVEDIYGEQICVSAIRTEENLSKEEKMILSFLESTPLHINVLQKRLGISVEVIQKTLFHLILKGKVEQTMNGWFHKV